MSVFSTPRHGPLIFEVEYEAKVHIMNYAISITGNSKKLFANIIHTKNPQPVTYKQPWTAFYPCT